jgi:hypothetical protein
VSQTVMATKGTKSTWMRSGALLLILLATLTAALLAPDANPDPAVVLTTQRVANAKPAVDARTPVSTSSSLNLAEPEVLQIRPRNDGDAADSWAALFAMPPAPAPSAPPPPPKIVAQPVMPALPKMVVKPVPIAAPPPALPFKVLGRYQDAEQTAVFLQDADQTWVAHVGDTIGQDYKVEAIEGQTLRLRHVPSNAVQTLDLGAVVDEVANPVVQQPPPAS